MFESEVEVLFKSQSEEDWKRASDVVPDGARVSNERRLGPHRPTVLAALATHDRWKAFATLAPLRPLDCGATLNDGEMPLLHYLAERVRHEEVALLMASGVSPELEDSKRCTPLEVSCINFHAHPKDFGRTADALRAAGGATTAWASALLGFEPEAPFPERTPQGIADRLITREMPRPPSHADERWLRCSPGACRTRRRSTPPSSSIPASPERTRAYARTRSPSLARFSKTCSTFCRRCNVCS